LSPNLAVRRVQLRFGFAPSPKFPARSDATSCTTDCWLDRPRIKLFRPDLYEHEVREVEAGTRWVFSLGVAF